MRQDENSSTSIQCIEWSPDGTMIAIGSSEGEVSIWDVVGSQRLQTLETGSWPVSCEWSPLGAQIAIGMLDSLITIWDVEIGSLERTLDGHFGAIRNLEWAADGLMIAALGSSEKSARTWDAETGMPLHALPSADGVSDFDWSPDSTAIATATGGGIKVWNAATGQHIYTLETPEWTRSVRWSPDGLMLLASGLKGAKAWEIIEKQPLGPFLPGDLSSSDALWSPDGKSIAMAYSGGPATVWNAETGARLLDSEGLWLSIVGLAWSPDSNYLAGFGRSYKWEDFYDWIFLWNLNEQQEPAVIKGHHDIVSLLEWSPTENKLASGSWDGRVIVWEPAP
jgi:WD40 repeat protein